MRRRRQVLSLWLVIVCAVFVISNSVQAMVWYVDDDAPIGGDGLSWAGAFGDLQDALDVAGVGSNEIWVAAGTYYPSYDYGLGEGNRGKHFRMKNGVGVYGGFTGTETNREQRDWAANPTILSGDLDSDGETSSGDAYHVFYHPDGTNLNETAVLDGFIISGGYSNGGGVHDYGGGMYNFNCTGSV